MTCFQSIKENQGLNCLFMSTGKLLLFSILHKSQERDVTSSVQFLFTTVVIFGHRTA